MPKMPNGRDQGGYVLSQSQADDLQKRQVAALESIARSLANITGGSFRGPNASNVTVSDIPSAPKQEPNFFSNPSAGSDDRNFFERFLGN